MASHIPGAVSAPTAGNVHPDGTFSSAAELTARFAALGARPGGVAVAAYCGSGVTAAHEVLALALAGHPRRALRRLLVQLDRRPRPSRGDRRLARRLWRIAANHSPSALSGHVRSGWLIAAGASGHQVQPGRSVPESRAMARPMRQRALPAGWFRDRMVVPGRAGEKPEAGHR